MKLEITSLGFLDVIAESAQDQAWLTQFVYRLPESGMCKVRFGENPGFSQFFNKKHQSGETITAIRFHVPREEN
jgi:hypothetical protein